MSRFFSNAKRAATKVAATAEELADAASLSIKIKALELRLEEQYEKLGEIVYRDLHTEEDCEEEKLAAIAAIDGLFDRIAVLKEQKANKAKAGVAEEAEPTADETEPET